jgi:hypothetical protein
MLGIKKESAWTFETSASGGLGVAIFAAEGGALYLRDPAKKSVVLHFGAAGAGLSCPVPKLDRRKAKEI